MDLNKSEFIRRLYVTPGALLAASLVLAGPASAEETTREPEPPTAEAKAVEEAGSPGMRIPFDGSSIEAFEETLEAIRAETTEAEFTTVQNALDYLLIYDLAARRDKEVLYERLDGKTPAEMLKMVKWKIRSDD